MAEVCALAVISVGEVCSLLCTWDIDVFPSAGVYKYNLDVAIEKLRLAPDKFSLVCALFIVCENTSICYK